MSKTTEPAEAAASQEEAALKSNNTPHEFVHRYETPPGPTASLSVTFAVDGFQFTFQGNTFEVGEGVGLLSTVPAMVKKLQGLEAEPGASPAIMAVPNLQGNGEPETKMCPIHNVVMKKRTGSSGTWYSHAIGKDAEGRMQYCNGQEKKS